MAPGACTIKNYDSVIYGFRGKIVCLCTTHWKRLTIEKALAYYEICPFSVYYESVMLYSTGPLFLFTACL
jgi:hypothetical protein